MTFAEILIFVALIASIVFLLSPLQKRIESNLYTYFKFNRKNNDDNDNSVIDVTDYSQKDKK